MQQLLFHGEHLPVRLAYQRLFSYLPTFSPQPHLRGRRRVDRNALLRALIYRALRRLTSLSDLVQALSENSSLMEAVGLNPLRPVPSLERFSDWLRCTQNKELQAVRRRQLRRAKRWWLAGLQQRDGEGAVFAIGGPCLFPQGKFSFGIDNDVIAIAPEEDDFS
jgi:hypothetical protein